MGVLGWAMIHGDLWAKSGNSMAKVLYFAIATLLCIVTYIMISVVLKNEEMGYLYWAIKDRLSKKEVQG